MAIRQEGFRFHVRFRGSMRQLTEDQKRVKDLAAAFTTPLVLFPGGWEDTLPEWLKLRTIAERVAMVCNGGWDKATDAEVTSYLYTASLAQPLGSDWTDITLYQAAKQMPQLYEALPNAPKELSDYQTQEIDHLKRDIRNSQLRRQNTKRKEGTMPTRKLVIDEKEGTVMMGVMKEGADPFIKNFQGDLETNLGEIPQLLQDAEAKWSVSLKNPTYKPPKTEPKKPAPKPATTATTGGTGKPTEDLPLLAATKPAATEEKPVGAPISKEAAIQIAEAQGGSREEFEAAEAAAETPVETAGEKPAETAQPATPGPEAQAQEPPAAAAAPAAEATPEAQAEETPPAAETETVKVPEQWPPVKDESKPVESGTEPTESGTEAPVSEPAPAAEVKPAETVQPAAPATPPAAPPAAAPASSGEWQYRLKDGRGPFATVQAAMDAMGLDKSTRPQHNRWDRLSTSLKDAIRREPKTS
jgi:hypothetical protein